MQKAIQIKHLRRCDMAASDIEFGLGLRLSFHFDFPFGKLQKIQTLILFQMCRRRLKRTLFVFMDINLTIGRNLACNSWFIITEFGHIFGFLTMSQIEMGNFVDDYAKLKYSIKHIIQIKSVISVVLNCFILFFN